MNNTKTLFESKFPELPKRAQEQLAAKNWKLSEHEIFAIVKAGGQADIRLFAKTVEEGAQSNLHQGIMDTDSYFMPTSLIVTSAVGGLASTLADALLLEFKALSPAIQNAVFSFEGGQEKFITKSSCGLFQTTRTDLEKGEYVLENPKFLKENEALRFDIVDLGVAVPDETWVKVRIKGLITSRN